MVFKQHELSVEVRNLWDKLEMLVNQKSRHQVDKVIEILTAIPGIEQVLWVEETEFTDLHDIYEQVKAHWHDKLAGKTFCVQGKDVAVSHEFTSTDIARYVGGGLNQHCETGGVKLKNPDVTVQL